jgi:hypothetical protein
MCCLQANVKGKKTSMCCVLSSDLNKGKNINVLSSALSKGKNIDVLSLALSKGKHIHVLSSVLSKWKEKTSMFFFRLK